jgi:hypothetical protein
MARLQRDLPTYIAAANRVSIDHGDEGDFTKEIKSWRKSHASEVGAWSEAARIYLAMAPRHCPFRLHLRVNFFSLSKPSVLMELENKAELCQTCCKETEKK